MDHATAEKTLKSLSSKLKPGNNIKPLVIGHRGASGYYPENTIISFQAAQKAGADMIELDVLLSKDGVPVVIHDLDLSRTTNGKGLVSETSLINLKKLDAGSWYSPRFHKEQIPALSEVLNYASGMMSVNIEIKTEAVTDRMKGGIVDKVLEVVEECGMQEQVLISSFDYRVMAHMNKLNPDVPTALLYEKKKSGKLLPSMLIKKYKAQAINCTSGELNKKWIRDCRENQIPVFIYTVNRKRRMRRLIDIGVRGIFTDRPDLMRQLVDNMWETK